LEEGKRCTSRRNTDSSAAGHSSSVSFPREASSSSQALSYYFFLSVSSSTEALSHGLFLSVLGNLSEVYINKSKYNMKKNLKKRNERQFFM
jgi:hypothetical protein